MKREAKVEKPNRETGLPPKELPSGIGPVQMGEILWIALDRRPWDQAVELGYGGLGNDEKRVALAFNFQGISRLQYFIQQGINVFAEFGA